MQLDLFGHYKSPVALYPVYEAYFRARKPPLLTVWGKNDPFFVPPDWPPATSRAARAAR